MQRLMLGALGVCLATATMTGVAQDPVKISPQTYHVAIDNPQVRVLKVVAAPGAKTAMHEHPDNVTVILTDGKMTFAGADGKSETMDVKAGSALWSGPQKHMGTNAGTSPLEAIVVELKGAAAPKATLPASRPNLSITRLIENPRVDVSRVTADGSFKEAPGTTHDFDQVLIALGPATLSLENGGKTITTWKRGDTAFIGRGQPHQAQNTGGKATDLIVVAIK